MTQLCLCVGIDDLPGLNQKHLVCFCASVSYSRTVAANISECNVLGKASSTKYSAILYSSRFQMHLSLGRERGCLCTISSTRAHRLGNPSSPRRWLDCSCTGREDWASSLTNALGPSQWPGLR